MTAADFKKIVEAYGGVDYLIGVGFDNSSGITFMPGQFSYSSNLDETNDVLKFTEYDSKGTPFIVLKPIETIQAIMIKDASVNSIEIYDRVSVRG